MITTAHCSQHARRCYGIESAQIKSAVHCEDLVRFDLQAAEASFLYMELSTTVLACQRGKKCLNSVFLVVDVPKLVNKLTDFSCWLISTAKCQKSLK